MPKTRTDHNLPYLYWYAAEPLVAENPAKGLALATKGQDSATQWTAWPDGSVQSERRKR